MKLLVGVRGDHREFEDVEYAEIATRALDGMAGVAMQFEDGSTDFVVDGSILGTYEDGVLPDDATERLRVRP